MNLPNLHRLEVFLAIVDSGSLSGAARALGLTQSTVSTHLRHLETDVEAVLIDRTGRNATTTEAGAVLLEYARTILDLSHRALTDLEHLGNRPVAGTLAIGATTTTGEHLLPRLLTAYTRRYPNVRIDLTVANTGEIIRKIVEGDLALGLIAGTAEHTALHTERIGDEPQVVIVAGNHLLAGARVDPRELRSTTVLMRESGSSTRSYQEQLLAVWRIPHARTSSIAGTSAIISAVAHGLGMSCVPRACAQDALDLGRVAEIRLLPEPEDRPVHLIRRHDKPLTTTEDLFLRNMTERAEQ
ncbi:LysR family transcriptional regulator [Nocardia callitridis]|uniref:Selenium metabolism-associated LysR family transcriptional regulator n=1 Tax=Nocardia callitridis TaxID=648753 RepID=A0ABP9K688_9NOCA